ncbi:MAG TPA: hypothetical protein VFT67_08180, partial [Jatrophihabitantaceae bacterium]|nr:hypothetical protein [Jatrophihabitantaceae bacterium]
FGNEQDVQRDHEIGGLRRAHKVKFGRMREDGLCNERLAPCDELRPGVFGDPGRVVGMRGCVPGPSLPMPFSYDVVVGV